MQISEITSRLFCADRLRGDLFDKGQGTVLSTLSSMRDFGTETDRFILSMSAPVRRLQQKTQVFPLDVKATSRNRLTHSLEVQEYTRLIACAIKEELKKQGTDISEIFSPMLCALSNAALIHDIGNPPFGHFGESLIRTWIKSAVENRHVSSEMSLIEKDDLLNFNGNAQGLRLVHSIQDLNLTLGQYASVIKVPYTLKELLLGKGRGNAGNGIHSDYYSWAYANAGVFLSEKYLLDEIRVHTGRDMRHPFASIIEYADDLAYVMADFEDAFDRGLFGRHTVLNLCEKLNEYTELGKIRELLNPDIIESLFARGRSEGIFYIRDVISYYVIQDIARAIVSNFEMYLETGEPDFSQGAYHGMTVLELFRRFENDNVYDHSDVQILDLCGARYLTNLFSMYEKLLTQDSDAIEKELLNKGGEPYCKRLASRISERHKKAYFKAVATGSFSEMYLRLRLIVDYISGMTDTYAESEYQIINGIH